jgi:phosphate transport system protein
MTHIFQERQSILNDNIIEEATIVEQMIEKIINALINKDTNLLQEIIDIDEAKVNSLVIGINEMIIQLIARFQPEAGDLRSIMMIYKINADFERIAKKSSKIAKSILLLMDEPPLKPFQDVPQMLEATLSMLKDSITSFATNNVQLAYDVCERDDIVDKYRSHISRELLIVMIEDSSLIQKSQSIERITRNIERIADHATNIAEDVIYIVEGEFIKTKKSKS